MFPAKPSVLILAATLILVGCTGAKEEPEQPATAGQTEPIRMIGMYRYMADAGIFTECTTAARLPVATEADNASLESAYLAARDQPGEELLVSLTGRIEQRPPMEGDGTTDTLIVSEFEQVWPTESCEKITLETPLTNTFWKLISVNGNPVETRPDQRQDVHLQFQPEGDRVSGFAGCNRINGSYQADGESLTFGLLATTMMACPQLDQETAFLSALESVKGYKILGESLALSDEESTIARFKAVELE